MPIRTSSVANKRSQFLLISSSGLWVLVKMSKISISYTNTNVQSDKACGTRPVFHHRKQMPWSISQSLPARPSDGKPVLATSGFTEELSNKILSSFQKQLITLYMHKFPLKMHSSTLFNSWFNFKLIWGINIWRFWRFRVASIIFSKGNEYLADITFFQYGTPIALNSWFHIRCLQTANFSWMQTQNYSLDLSLCAKSCPPTWTQLNIIRTLILSPFCPF